MRDEVSCGSLALTGMVGLVLAYLGLTLNARPSSFVLVRLCYANVSGILTSSTCSHVLDVIWIVATHSNRRGDSGALMACILSA
jgi:site-specific recombinase